MPTYVCIVCKTYKFNAQVVTYKLSTYQNKNNMVYLAAVPYADPLKDKQYICKTCHNKILKGNKPPIAYDNHLQPTEMPPGLENLNTLEEQLVSPIIPFMKIVSLHKTRQNSIHGPVICVPANVDNTATILPRPIHDTGLINVKLKRKLEYKGHHLFQKVDPSKVMDTLHHLKLVNPAFQGI